MDTEQLTQIEILNYIVHISLQDNVNDKQCNYLNELQNTRFYYQIDGKLKYLDEYEKETYDIFTTRIESISEFRYFSDESLIVYNKLIEERKALLK